MTCDTPSMASVVYEFSCQLIGTGVALVGFGLVGKFISVFLGS